CACYTPILFGLRSPWPHPHPAPSGHVCVEVVSPKRLPVARFQFRSSILIHPPREQVWAVLIESPRVASWERDIREVRQTSPGPAGVGTTLVVRRVYFGRETQVACQITAWDERQGVTMDLRGGPLRYASVRYAVESVGACR